MFYSNLLNFRKIRESLQNLQAQVEKLKKDSSKEMENNERLTSLQTRINEEIKLVKKLYESDKEKYLNLELNFVKISKLVEQSEKEFTNVSTVCTIFKITICHRMQNLFNCL